MRFSFPGNWEWNQAHCTSDFTKWTDGEPNDYCGGEDCAVAGGDLGNEWNDLSCNQTAFCACEYGTSELSDDFSDWDPEDGATGFEGCAPLAAWIIWIESSTEMFYRLSFALTAFIGFILSIIGIVTACKLSEQGSKGCAGCAGCPPGTQYGVAIAFLIVDVIGLLLQFGLVLGELLGRWGVGEADQSGVVFYFVCACTATAAIVTLKNKQQFWNVTQQPNQPQASEGEAVVELEAIVPTEKGRSEA